MFNYQMFRRDPIACFLKIEEEGGALRAQWQTKNGRGDRMNRMKDVVRKQSKSCKSRSSCLLCF